MHCGDCLLFTGFFVPLHAAALPFCRERTEVWLFRRRISRREWAAPAIVCGDSLRILSFIGFSPIYFAPCVYLLPTCGRTWCWTAMSGFTRRLTSQEAPTRDPCTDCGIRRPAPRKHGYWRLDISHRHRRCRELGRADHRRSPGRDDNRRRRPEQSGLWHGGLAATSRENERRRCHRRLGDAQRERWHVAWLWTFIR